MQTERFEAWLRAEGLSDGTISSRLSSCRRLETHEGDLDEHFDSDRLRGLLDDLAYSAGDEHRGAPPRHKVPIEGNIRTGSASLKSAATLYWQFRNDGDERQDRFPSRPRRRQMRRAGRSMSHQQVGTHSSETSQAREDHGNWAAMIAAGESATVEFKETLRKNVHTGENDSRMEDAVVKTIAGFLNTHGGTLFIGVKDDRSVPGTGAEFDDEDKMGLVLQNRVNRSIGRSAWAAIHANFHDIDGARVLVVECEKASRPAFVKQKRDGIDLERFYMRTNNATEELLGNELHEYLRSRFSSG